LPTKRFFNIFNYKQGFFHKKILSFNPIVKFLKKKTLPNAQVKNPESYNKTSSLPRDKFWTLGHFTKKTR
jgi:hypothetical protein